MESTGTRWRNTRARDSWEEPHFGGKAARRAFSIWTPRGNSSEAAEAAAATNGRGARDDADGTAKREREEGARRRVFVVVPCGCGDRRLVGAAAAVERERASAVVIANLFAYVRRARVR